jgi:hypothetical protein
MPSYRSIARRAGAASWRRHITAAVVAMNTHGLTNRPR